jgi:putative membrane protein
VIRADAAFSDAVSAAVEEVERHTSAEVVVVVAPWSGSYADRATLAGVVAAMSALVGMIYSPVVFTDLWIPIDVACIGAATTLLGLRLPRWLVRLVGPRRRRLQSVEAAKAAFFDENVHATADRTGVLVYLSLAESEVVVLADHGVAGRIPGTALSDVKLLVGSRAEFCDGLRALGAVLAAHLPPVGSNPDEIPNAPRIRT